MRSSCARRARVQPDDSAFCMSAEALEQKILEHKQSRKGETKCRILP